MRQSTKTKISKTQKRNWRTKKSMRDVKAILGFILVFVLINQVYLTLKPIPTTANTDRHTYLPQNPDKETLTVYEKRQIVANKIRGIGKARNFKWLDYAVNIACEESLLGTEMENTRGNTPSWSKDRGYWGINDHWHAEISDECAYDITCSTNFFMDMVENGRQHEWCSDKKVKGKPNYSLNKCGVK